MKITKSRLRQIIKEEISRALQEEPSDGKDIADVVIGLSDHVKKAVEKDEGEKTAAKDYIISVIEDAGVLAPGEQLRTLFDDILSQSKKLAKDINPKSKESYLPELDLEKIKSALSDAKKGAGLED